MKHLKIGQKMLVLIITAVLFLLMIGGTSYFFLNQTAEKSKEIYENKLVSIQNIGQIRTNNRAITAYTLELMITTDSNMNQELRQKTESLIDENNKLMEDYLNASKSDPKELELAEPFVEEFKTFSEKAIDAQILAGQNKNKEAYEQYLAEVEPARAKMTELGTQLSNYNRDTAAVLNKENQESAQKANAIILIASLLSILLFAGLAILISRMITHPIRAIQELMSQAQKGDLTVAGTYASRDELGQLTASFNDMTNGLRDVIRQVAETAEQVAASSEELNANSEETTRATELIANTMEEMASGSDSQLRQVSDTTATMNELADGVQQIARNAHSVSETAAGAIERATAGNTSIRQAVNQMGSINTTFDGLSGVIQGLGRRSNEIGQIIDSITAIAAQTNLLALNAAIEAARAGEQGRGFAVVADEVRKLAEESAQSASQISELISAIQAETAQAVEAMKSATAEVQGGIDVVHNAGGSFADITSAIGDVTGQIQEVSAAVQQMAAGTEQVVASMDQIHSISEKAAASTENVSAASEEQMASMEEIAASARSLAVMATHLQEMTRRFTV
ncbi:methyl-accepting chemotaxis protein [Domibacillus sp. PGB-M46]|uniref:methyl-accepting chemotaxis protein n=1 Tax=Domibacillus sp. PGB-M46 TaxID=2910255 RepID=UPI001F59E6FB|nr:methyl-accepting chemotaxis protein [Domibacillus sp. PGB-M46]MCI2252819.1 methyl-accepting chemotaxis protein [Domibacillus sp. PGB-M46]